MPTASKRKLKKSRRCGGSFEVERKQGELDSVERELTLPEVWSAPERAKGLRGATDALQAHRNELLDLAVANGGNTRGE